MKVLSLFDGISCGMVALERAGINVDKYDAYEIDESAIKISTKNYPQIEHHGDVTSAKYYDSQYDLLIGGSPCQSLSSSNVWIKEGEYGVTGTGASKLFWEYVRLLKEVKPKYFLLENVKMAKKWENVITKALGVKPILLNSQDFSPQRRQRLYWTNIGVKQIEDEKKDKRVLRDIVRTEDNNQYHLTVKHLNGFKKSYKWTENLLDEKSKPLLASYYKQPPHCPYISCKESGSGYRMLSPIECERLQGLPDNYTDGISKTQRYKCIGNGWNVDTIVHIFKNLK